MNGEILRGEVYWVCLDGSRGGEEKTGRPGLVISSNGLNEKEETVTIAFMSNVGFASPNRPSVVNPQGGRSRVLCNQLITVDKSRLSKYMWSIDDSELIRVTGALACTLCIPTPRPEKKKDESDEVVTSLRCEAEMWRRMYEKVMDQLVEIRVAADIAKKIEPKEEPVVAEEPMPVVMPGLVEPDPGYEEDVQEPEKKPEPKKIEWDGIKVNVNTVATGAELKARTGMAMRTACEIVRVREAVGKYEKLDDLLALDHFGDLSMKRYGHMLTVEDEPAETVPETEKKQSRVNVNKDNAHKLMEVGFSKTVANRIVHHQKNCTPFRDIDELLEIDGITRGDLRKLRDKLEV